MLDDKEKSRLQAISDSDKRTAIADECSRIHCAVNDGSLDRDSVNDALERIGAMVSAEKKTNAKPDATKPATLTPAAASPPDAPV